MVNALRRVGLFGLAAMAAIAASPLPARADATQGLLETIHKHVTRTSTITDNGDLKAAATQKGDIAKAKVPLLTATETAVKANAGYQAVGIYPELQRSSPVAEMTLLQGATFRKAAENLD